MPSLGTRLKAQQRTRRDGSRDLTRSIERDPNGAKYIGSTSFVFDSVAGTLTGAGGLFAAFAVGDLIFVAGTNLNNGNFLILLIDGPQTVLTLERPPKDESPATLTRVRTR